jgi:hypothetical protein
MKPFIILLSLFNSAYLTAFCQSANPPPPHCFISLRSKYSPQCSDLNLCHFLIVKDQIPNPYKTNKILFDLSGDYEEYYYLLVYDPV